MDIQRVQDINISDSSLKNEYVEKYNNRQYSLAYNILENNNQLDSKQFIAEVINFISNALYSIEQEYYDNSNYNFTELIEEFQLVIDNYKYIGNWNNNTQYRIYNIVTYSDKHYIYINNTPSSGIPVSNLNYWVQFDLKGETGADGIGINFKGTWSSSISYNNLDGVYYNGAIWCCKIANTNQVPNSSSSYWENVITFLKAKIVSTMVEPVDKYDGLIWLEILS